MNKDVKFASALKRIFKYSSGFKKGFIIVLILSILAAIFSVLTPYLLGLITTSLFDSITNKTSINYNFIFKTMIILSILYILYALFNYLKSVISVNIAQKLCYNIRRDLIKKINKLDIKELETRKKGDITSIVVNDVEEISDFFSNSIPELFYHAVLMVGIIFMMLYISIKLSIITFITIPIIFIFLSFVIKKTQKYFDLNQSTLGSVNGFIEESITNDLTIKSNNQEKYFNKKFEKENKDLYTYNFKSALYSGILHPIINFITNINYCLVIGLGAYYAIKGIIKVGEIQAFVKYMQDFSRPLAMLGEIMGSLQSTAASTNRIFTIIDNNNITEGSIKEINNPELISLNNVSFSYNENKQVLKDINFEIKKGQQVAIVGETGSGKTTIINLLMAFYKVSDGSILFDKNNINDIKRKALREKVGMVLQDSWVINGTIKENITFDTKFDEEKLKKAIKEANLNHIINSKPNGLNFMINEEANNISEGEKQLITIARALITSPDILILDEATSNVDSRLEYLIHNSMKKLMKNRTVIVIAHRLSTIINSDKIVVIKDGKVQDIGTHKELLKKKGYYYELYNSGFSN